MSGKIAVPKHGHRLTCRSGHLPSQRVAFPPSASIMDSRHSKRLVDNAAAGDGQALDQLFARCEGRLRRLIVLKGPRHADVDDLVQEAYLEATKQFADYTYQGPDSFFRWLATVALNRLANLQRMAQAQKR